MHRKTLFSLLFLLSIVLPGAALAQDGLMGSAETINQGNFKLMVHPMLLLDGDSELGVAARVGYGFSSSADVEFKAAFFDGLTFFGGDIEVWVIRGNAINVSLAGGGHFSSFSGDLSVPGLDAAVTVSTRPADRLELYGGLDFAFEFPEDPFDSFTRINLVPGLEYRVAQDIDLLIEGGIGLNDDSFDYLSIGGAYYIR